MYFSLDKPPKVTESYIAWGEITQPVKDLNEAQVQIHFEETYDSSNQNAGFMVWLNGNNVTYVKNFKTNQTFRYEENTEGLGKSFTFNLKVGIQRCNTISANKFLVNGEKLPYP